ncbi:MAG TPA: hypothetical protein VFG21_09795 [Xanthomonadaceae bacterium]|nr:hypothetical protein [Xanthomonadaceae bacterium]
MTEKRRPAAARPRAGTWLLGLVATLTGVLGVAAIWTIANLFNGRLNGWLALLAALDAVLLLRLAGFPRGGQRALLAVGAPLAAAAVAVFLSSSIRIGASLGLEPMDSVTRMGIVFAWDLALINAQPWDWAFLGLALGIAAWLGR